MQKSATDSQGSAGTNLLGFGYDIFGTFLLSPTQKCLNLSDDNSVEVSFGDYTYYYPAECSTTSDIPAEMSMTEGTSMYSYTKTVNQTYSLGVEYGAFSGSASAEFSSQDSYESETYVGTVSEIYNGYGVKIQTDISEWESSGLLESSFKLALLAVANSLTSEGQNSDTLTATLDFFNQYGSYIVTGVLVGGACSYSAYSSTETVSSINSFSTQMEASYSYLTGSASYEEQYEENKSTQYSSSSLEIKGGDPTGLDLTNSQDFATWSSTISANPDVLDFYRTSGANINQGIVPVWDVLDKSLHQQQAAQALEDAFYYLYRFTRSNEPVKYVADGDYNYDDRSYCCQWQSSDPYEVVVGFAAKLKSDGMHFRCIAVKVYNFETEATQWYTEYYKGDKSNRSGVSQTIDYDDFDCVSEIDVNSVTENWADNKCVVTGIGLRKHDNEIHNCMLYVQDLNPNNLDKGLLRTAMRSLYYKKGHNNLQQDTYDDLDKDLSVDFNPQQCSSGNSVLCGIYVNSSNSSNGLNDLTVWTDQLTINARLL
jgi:hypothetical protein